MLLIIFMLVLPSVYLKKQSTFHLCSTDCGISYLDLCSSILFSIPYYTFFFFGLCRWKSHNRKFTILTFQGVHPVVFRLFHVYSHHHCLNSFQIAFKTKPCFLVTSSSSHSSQGFQSPLSPFCLYGVCLY